MTSPVPDQEQQPWENVSRPQQPPREQGSDQNRLVIVSIAAAAVVLLGTVASVWWFSGRTTPPSHPHAAPPVSTPKHTTKPKPDNSAYGIGTCLDEPADPKTGGVELTPVPCAGNSSVLIVNQVVKDYNDCSQGADYLNHGFVLTDEVANVAYCVSLVVPADQCFSYSNDNSKPIARAACGSAADVVRVEAVETAASVTAACTDQQQPQDVWYYQSPASGQFACVTPLSPSASSTTDTPPTTS